MHYEIIFEDGSNSVAGYESDEEALEAITAAHVRAVAGGRSLESEPNSPPASRVVKVLKYEEHPGSLYEDQVLPVEVLREVFDAAVGDSETVSVPEVAAAIRNATNPQQDSEPHESNFKMEEEGELEGPWQ